jgi:signal transduction histidine kinase
MPEHRETALPTTAARHLTTLRVALSVGFIISLGWLFFSGISPYSIVWCALLWCVLAVIWKLLGVFCASLKSGLQEHNAPPVQTHPSDAAFLSAMGHDLRQPAQAIALFAATLSAHPLPESSRKLVVGIESAIQQLSEQLEAVFGIAKVYAGRVSCTAKKNDLGAMFSLVVAPHLDDAHEHSVHLRHVNTTCLAIADEDALVRILDRLVRHALDITKAGGIVLGCRPRGKSVVIEVWCNGKSIDVRQLDGIFVPGSAYGQQLPDRGLGLALAKSLADLMQAPLSVTSFEGKGCVFRLTLPRVVPAVA